MGTDAHKNQSRHEEERLNTQTGGSGFWIGWIVVITLVLLFVGVINNTTGHGPNHEQHTRVTIRALMAIATEYEVQTQLTIDHSIDPPDYDGEPTGIGRFIFHIKKNATTYTMLMTIGNDALGDEKPPTTVYDAWGNEIRYVNLRKSDGVKRAETGITEDNKYGIYFASAGPDGEWGDAEVDGESDYKSADNIYSYEVR